MNPPSSTSSFPPRKMSVSGTNGNGGSSSSVARNSWLVAVDASNVARKAFDVAVFLMRSAAVENSHLHLLHVQDMDAEKLLPVNCRASFVVNSYQSNILDLKRCPGTPECHVQLAVKRAQSSLKQEILDAVDRYQANVLVSGFMGSGAEQNAAAKLGSIADVLTRSSPVTTLIVKNWARIPDSPNDAKYLIAVDGSTASKIAFRIGMSLINSTKPENVQIIHLSQHFGPKDKAVIDEYEDTVKKSGKLAVVKFVPRNTSRSVGEDIVQYSKDNDTDFIIIGSVGLSGSSATHRLGSVADFIVRHSRCHNVIAKLSSS